MNFVSQHRLASQQRRPGSALLREPTRPPCEDILTVQRFALEANESTLADRRSLATSAQRRVQMPQRQRQCQQDEAPPGRPTVRSTTSRAPWRSMILDPLLGAHGLCFELSDECSETR